MVAAINLLFADKNRRHDLSYRPSLFCINWLPFCWFFCFGFFRISLSFWFSFLFRFTFPFWFVFLFRFTFSIRFGFLFWFTFPFRLSSFFRLSFFCSQFSSCLFGFFRLLFALPFDLYLFQCFFYNLN